MENRAFYPEKMPLPGGPYAHGVEIPEDGGATCYGDLAQAYEALPDELKEKIANKTVTYSIARAAETQKLGLPEVQRRAKPPLSHPLVRTHPYLARKALYISPNHALPADRASGSPPRVRSNMSQFCPRSFP